MTVPTDHRKQNATSGRLLPDWWQRPGRSTAGIGLLLSLLLMLTIIVVVRAPSANRVTEVDLFESVLSQGERSRIRLALVAANLTEFRFQNDHLLVPATAQARYLEAIKNADSLPDSIGVEDSGPQISMFMSPSLQQQAQQQHRQEQLRRLLLSLPFVAEARVQIDSRSATSAFERPDMRCVVSIKPHAELLLDREQLRTIHQNAFSSIAGIEADQIIVTDLNSGRAWDYSRLDSAPQRASLVDIHSLQEQREYEHLIARELADWPGIHVIVSRRESPMLADFHSSATAATGETGAVSPEVVNAGANASVKVTSASTSSSRGEEGRHWGIEVEVGEAAISEFLKRPENASPSSWGASAPAPDSELVRQQIRDELTVRIRKALGWSDNDAAKPVDVCFCQGSPVATARQQGGSGIGRLLNGSKGLGIVVLVGAGLLILAGFTFNWRKNSLSARGRSAPSSTPEVWVDQSKGRDEKLRRQIEDLLKKNPENAAMLIQDIIRDAA